MLDRKKILLVNPPGMNWVAGEKDVTRIVNIMPPVGLCSLAAWLDEHGYQTAIHDCYASPDRDDRMTAFLRSERPAYLGIGATTSGFPSAVRVARVAKQMLPEIKTVFGGVHVSALREELLRKCPEIDYAVVGEGEETLLALLDNGGEGDGSIPGLVYRDGGEPVFTGFRKPALELDRLPFPAYHKLPGFPRSYKLAVFNFPRSPGTMAVTSRGCMFQCSYCDRSVFRRSYRYNSGEYVSEFMTYLNRRFGIRHVSFCDDQFTFNRERTEEFCRRRIRDKVKMTFNCAVHAAYVDAELLTLMKEAGCWLIGTGIESGDAELLKKHRTHTNLGMIRDQVAAIRKAGIRVKGLFMMGLPGETEESIDKTIDYALSLRLDDINVPKFTPFPGSPIYKTITDYGTFDENWELMNTLNWVFVPHGFTPARLQQRHREFYRRHYMQPHVIMGLCSMLWKSPESWYRFGRDLGSFLGVIRSYERTR